MPHCHKRLIIFSGIFILNGFVFEFYDNRDLSHYCKKEMLLSGAADRSVDAESCYKNQLSPTPCFEHSELKTLFMEVI